MGLEVARQSKEQFKREEGFELMQRGHIACIVDGHVTLKAREYASATADRTLRDAMQP
jgi:hypothetical protein